MVIDYRKWDHIDTDSSSDKEPSKPLETAKAGRSKQVAESLEQGTEEGQRQRQVQCVRVFCVVEANRGMFERTLVPASHPVFRLPISPVSQLIELPLCVYLEKPLESALFHPNRAAYDNQRISYLMIDPFSGGFAPSRYQAGVGTALVARADLKPLSEDHFESVFEFISNLLDQYDEGPDAIVPNRDITRAKFERFFKWYHKNTVSP